MQSNGQPNENRFFLQESLNIKKQKLNNHIIIYREINKMNRHLSQQKNGGCGG